MKKNCKSVLILVILFFLFCYSLFHSQQVVEEILYYTKMFLYKVFPTSFLFLLLSSLMMDYHILYYVWKFIHQKSLYFFIISIMSGYPAGAVLLKDALNKGDITTTEANQMIQYCHFPNPLFIFYNLTFVFSKKTTIFFYFIILISQFIILLFSKKGDNKNMIICNTSKPFSYYFITSTFKVFKIILTIYSTSIFFYLISCFFKKYFIFNPYIYVFFNGLFDLTNGVMSTSILTNTFIQELFLFFFIVFGSIPIHLQIKSILSDTSISYSSFIRGRILSLFFCILLWIIYTCCTISIG